MGQRKGYKQTAEHIANRIKRGEKHQNWIGDSVSVRGGRTRALRIYPKIGPCEVCGKEKTERHHKDGNTANNSPDNISILCRKCHMVEDNRLDRLKDRSGIAKASKVAAEAKRSMTHCKGGHPLSGENLYEHGGRRHCRECARIHGSNYKNRKKVSK
jgi:hypothetical protein